MPLTSLSRNLLASSAVSAAVLCKYGGSIATVAISATLALAAYVLHRRPDGSLTIQDRCLINLDRLSSGMSPGRGTIACCLYFDASKVPTAAAARSAMKRALARYPRFASVAVETPSLEDSSFRACEVDLDAHVFEHAPIIGGSAALEERLNALINTDLPRGLPLWRWDLLPTADGASGAVLLRANHALADGLRLLGVGGEFLSFGSGAPATVDLARMTKGTLAPTGWLARMDPTQCARASALRPSGVHARMALRQRRAHASALRHSAVHASSHMACERRTHGRRMPTPCVEQAS
jgi:hypothetical protein